jgi:L-aminopeptidase/D-esterase-like protein
MLVQHVDAIVLTGGSAFGLAAADGVMRFLEERGRGFETPVGRVPIVPAAVLFDLGVGDPAARPGPDEGRQACLAAGHDVAEGNVGAGTGCTVAKQGGLEGALKGGLGTAAVEEGNLVVAALAAVNALGEIVGGDGEVIAAARSADPAPTDATNTTLVVVATNAALSRERAHLLARAAHDGISAAVRPAHTMWDGDTVYSLATGQVEGDQRRIEAMAVEAVAGAIRRGVLLAESVPGFPAAKEVRHERDEDAR